MRTLFITVFLVGCSGARDVGGMELGAAPSGRQHGSPAPRPPVPGAGPRHRLPPLPSKIFRSVTLYPICSMG